jgi:hypothetical protein
MMKTLVVIAITFFSIILLLTVFNIIFQTGPADENTTDFPNPIFNSLNIDVWSKYGLIAFCGIALCFCIFGFPRKK